MTSIQPIKTLGNIKRQCKRYLHRQSGAGFTLIELLIVAAVFAVTALLATTVFTNVQTTQRQVQSQQRTSTDGRYIMETIARSIRTGTLNYSVSDSGYSAAGEVTNPVTKISTVDQAGVVTCFRLDTNQVQLLSPATASCETQGGSTWTSFTPGDLTVDALNFYVTPRSDPFRPVPRSSSDCKVAANAGPPAVGFDTVSGSCLCPDATNAAPDATKCFAGQTCDATETTYICHNSNIQPQVTIYLKTSSTNTAPGERASVTLQTTVVSRIYQR
ncbi:MAG: type II secretion system protein [Patescibacteria group bacterium]